MPLAKAQQLEAGARIIPTKASDAVDVIVVGRVAEHLARATEGQAVAGDFGGRIIAGIQGQLLVHRQRGPHQVAVRRFAGGQLFLRFRRRGRGLDGRRVIGRFAFVGRGRRLGGLGRGFGAGVVGPGPQPGRNEQTGRHDAERDNARKANPHGIYVLNLLEAGRFVRYRFLRCGPHFLAPDDR